MKKEKKQQKSSKGDNLSIDGSFDDVVNASVGKTTEKKVSTEAVGSQEFNLPGGSKVTVTPLDDVMKEGKQRFDFIIKHDNGKTEGFILTLDSTKGDDLDSIYKQQALLTFFKNRK